MTVTWAQATFSFLVLIVVVLLAVFSIQYVAAWFPLIVQAVRLFTLVLEHLRRTKRNRALETRASAGKPGGFSAGTKAQL